MSSSPRLDEGGGKGGGGGPVERGGRLDPGAFSAQAPAAAPGAGLKKLIGLGALATLVAAGVGKVDAKSALARCSVDPAAAPGLLFPEDGDPDGGTSSSGGGGGPSNAGGHARAAAVQARSAGQGSAAIPKRAKLPSREAAPGGPRPLGRLVSALCAAVDGSPCQRLDGANAASSSAKSESSKFMPELPPAMAYTPFV